jgi:hypothetical protein
MAEFPKLKNWRRQFKQAAASADTTNELPRITALFERLTECLICREGFEYDGARSWLENTESETTRQEFQAILAQFNPHHHAKVLTPRSLETAPLWQVKKQNDCPRNANDMALLISAMLSNCSEVHFIDPHFDPRFDRWFRPLEEFLHILATSRRRRPCIDTIMFHTSDNDKKLALKEFRRACNAHLSHRIPKSTRLVLQRWKQRDGGEKLHNRYILTDIGGVKFDPGLDEGDQGESVEVILLERYLYEKQWKDYITSPAFDSAEDSFEIIGTKGK